MFMALLLFFAALFFANNWLHSYPWAYKTTTGKILDTRQVIDGARDSMYGGRIVYAAEAYVQYTIDGHSQLRWLRISDDMSQVRTLEKLADHPTKCIVYWLPELPENAKCSLK